MSALRSFRATDLLTFNNVNLDVLTETFSIQFYLNYLSKWPDLCAVQEAPNGRTMGYVIGKAEGTRQDWHGHVSALTIAPEYRRLGLGRSLMDLLERVSDERYRGFFVDLFVRCSNLVGIRMYEGMGYSVWRRINDYYQGSGAATGSRDDMDGFDMRKPMSRDPERRSVRSQGREMVVSVHDLR